MIRKYRIKKILKKGVSISGAIMRTLAGISAMALLFFSLKKKKK
jgi:hypothetical protein